jgi:hypothetical protein
MESYLKIYPKETSLKFNIFNGYTYITLYKDKVCYGSLTLQHGNDILWKWKEGEK